MWLCIQQMPHAVSIQLIHLIVTSFTRVFDLPLTELFHHCTSPSCILVPLWAKKRSGLSYVRPHRITLPEQSVRSSGKGTKYSLLCVKLRY